MHPCLSCGACCATFRVSFYWAEGDDGGGTVPAELTEPLTPFLRAMRGTNEVVPRCVSLEGQVGGACRCAIHPLRPSPCREFAASYEAGTHHDRCDTARACHGLPPLTPADYLAPR